MRRIGIFGGAFDPPHLGHLMSAEEVREVMSLEKVLFIPSANPPLKSSEAVTDMEIRLKLTEMSVLGNSYFEANDIEISLFRKSREKSYTVNTILELRKIYQRDEFKLYVIIGMDQLALMDKWYNPEKLLAMSEVIVINKPGFTVKDVKNDYLKKVTLVPVKNIEISSSDIRERVRQGKSIKYLVTEQVEKFIKENKLYI